MSELTSHVEERVKSLIAQGKKDEALTECRDAALFAINQTAALYLEQFNDLQAAIGWMQHMISLGPEKAMAHSNLAFLYLKCDRVVEALMSSQRAVDANVPLAEIFYNHGVILARLERYEEAIEAYRKALEINPNYSIVHFNLGSCLIAIGQFREGLKEYEWRFKSHEFLAYFRRRYEGPDWDGEADLRGKTILVVNEQGTGDAVQFCRYLPKLKEKGCKVIVEVQDELVNLFSQLGVGVLGRSHDLEERRPLPAYDYVTNFSSLLYFFNPDMNDVSPVSYLRPTKSRKVPESFWKKYPCKTKVGLCWGGSIWHPQDNIRSCPLKYFAPLTEVDGVRLFSLQKGPMIREWGNLMEGAEGIEVVNTDAYTHDFDETANFITQLDLVITVDTTVAHLAGALGRPVWMLTAQTHDWRWETGRQNTDWYPTMKIFEQSKLGDWQKVINNVVGDLKTYGQKQKAHSAKRTKK